MLKLKAFSINIPLIETGAHITPLYTLSLIQLHIFKSLFNLRIWHSIEKWIALQF